jgi:hypothetical protein
MNRCRSHRLSSVLLAFALLFVLFTYPLSAWGQTSPTPSLTFDTPQTAGISGFRAFWNTPIVLSASGLMVETNREPFGSGWNAVWSVEKRAQGQQPGAIVFDAVHRSVLVRFPGSANTIAKALNKGFALAKVELALPHRATELWAEGYSDPPGMSFLGNLWREQKPRWHAIAYPLRRPWIADSKRGPTFNASIHGMAYWKRFGATDPKEDIYPTRFGPVEVSESAPEGRLDITPLLSDNAFGVSLEERLRQFEANGVLLRKWETYDMRYWYGGYEWATATGGRGIIVHTPRLIVTLRPAPSPKIRTDLTTELPLQRSGKPTAVMPTDVQFRSLVSRFKTRRPSTMPEWQWQRVQELYALGGATEFPATLEAFEQWMDSLLALPPRTWFGFQAAEINQAYFLFGEAWPAPVREHLANYWRAWLMPDLPHTQLVQGYIGDKENQAYIARTGDWRGTASIYRTYVRQMGTMNFNHWATNGVLLGGTIMGSPAMQSEGRFGLETFPARTWCWFDGSTQETLDHYYFAISLKDQKVFADLGPTLYDRTLGRNILYKSVGELASLYHPNLKRFISPSGRTGIAYLLTIQDGTKHIIHSLSRRGALTDMGRSETPGQMPTIGTDAAPGMIAQQALNSPWAEDWVSNVVDDKPLPFEMTASYKQWGAYTNTPLWKRTYLGKHYGVASVDVASGNQSVPLMAQWRRDNQLADHTERIGTLLARFGVNQTEFLDTIYHGTSQRNPNGVIGQQGGFLATFQHRNKLLAFTSPYPKLQYSEDRKLPDTITSIQTSIALIDLQAKPTWEIYVDGERKEGLPIRAKYGQRITLRDGVTYLGIIPLPGSTDLGRDVEVVIQEEGKLTEMQGGGKIKTSLVLNLYNYHSPTPLDRNRPDLDLAWGGFALELGDSTEFTDFQAFQKHIATAKVEVHWDSTTNAAQVAYHSGNDVMETGFAPGYTGNGERQVPTDQCFLYRRVNGKFPYLPKDIERDTTLAQFGRTGRIEKGGAVLTVAPGRMGCVEWEPQSGVFVAYTPLPDATPWKFVVPGGISLEVEGNVGMFRATVIPRENRIRIDHVLRPGDSSSLWAKSIRIRGLTKPQVSLNGKEVSVGKDGILRL